MAEKTTTPKKAAAPKKPAAHKPAKPAAAKKPAVKHAAHPKAAHAPKHEAPVAAEITPGVETKEVVITPMAKTGHGSSFYAVGKRKTSVAQILLTTGEGVYTLNKLPFESYFQTPDLQRIAMKPMVSMGVEKMVNIKAKLHGGGIHSQAEALRHAISRALIQYNPEARPQLKKQGFLKRDPRVKERKKPGLKRARRAPQFSKR